MRPAGVVVASVLGTLACSDHATDFTGAADRHLPTPAERAAAPKSSAERMFAPPADALAGSAPAAAEPVAAGGVHWSQLGPAARGCFFFSGPSGRDDQLTGPANVERNGDAVSITIGAAVFIGTFHDNELRAARKSRHDFGGTWTVTETLHGFYRDGLMTAAYHYSECTAGLPCPDRCTLDGTITFPRSAP
jgi:hypothetical protein